MHRRLFSGLIALFVFALAPSLLADTVTLKSGERLEGKVVMESSTSVWFQNETGKFNEYPVTDVEKIEKSPAASVKTTVTAQEEPQEKTQSIQKPGSEPQYLDHALFLIYVPAGIDRNTKHPLVIALSPNGDAQTMINTWIGVAEEYKWIIVASKEFKNGIDMNPILERLVENLKVVVEDFPIDKSRVIATGFSGGGMGAHAFAFSYPN